jgi:cytoskeleton protein RodZ
MTIQIELIPKRPGDILRQVREQQGLTIELASRQAGIKAAVLSAIESGETEEIPSVYLRGYIRNYARFLGVESDELEAQMGDVKGADPGVRTIFTVNTKRNGGEKWLKASSDLAASALIATLAWQFTHEAVRFSQGDSDRSAGTVVSAEPGPGNGQGAAADDRSANKHLNASIASVEMLGRQAGDSAAEHAWAAISGTPGAATESNSMLHSLSITTSADTWVEISDAAGNQLELDLIRAGTLRDYRGQPPFDVMIGRASAVVLNMDGSPVDLEPHTHGNVARMTLQSQ